MGKFRGEAFGGLVLGPVPKAQWGMEHVFRTLLACAWIVGLVGGVPGQVLAAETFANPVVPNGADPWVVRWEGSYYRSLSRDGAVWVDRFDRLESMGRGRAVQVWRPEAGTEFSKEIWAPEIHHLAGRWYLYVAADDGRNENHRMVVLEGDAKDPQGAYRFRGRLSPATDRWAIDGTVLRMPGGALYFLWSGWEGTQNVAQHLYIARMTDPVTLEGDRVKISSPDRPWEQHGRPWVNEGPQALWNGNRLFVVYSASGSWTDDYCLGLLTWTGGDPLRPESWVKHPEPVFAKTDRVFGPGHCSFVKSEDGREDWLVFHAARARGSGWDRQIHLQPFGWDDQGRPRFGVPVPAGESMPVPSRAANP